MYRRIFKAAFSNYAHMRELEVQTHLGYHFKSTVREQKTTETRNELHKIINMLQSRQLTQTRRTGNNLDPYFKIYTYTRIHAFKTTNLPNMMKLSQLPMDSALLHHDFVSLGYSRRFEEA
jgi:hypothetical protein